MFSTLDLEFPVPLMSDDETNHRLESSEPGDDADLLLTTCMSRRWHQHNVDCHLLLDSDEDFDEDNGQDVEDGGNLAPNIPLEDGPNNDESEFLDCDELGQDGGLPLRDELGESFESRYTMIGALYFVHLWSSKMLTIPAAEKLDESDHAMCRAFAFKVSTHMPDAAWKKACYAFHTTPPIPGLLQLRSRANFLAGFTAEVYDCCPNSCLCYTGPHSDATSCVYCGLSRYHGQGKPRKRFTYIPLIPRLQAFCTNAEIATRMQYRHQSESDAIPGVIRDVFDGAHYKALKSKIVQIDKKTFQHRYFDGSQDIALGLSTDGFAPFNKRKSTTWPIIVFNYNLPPEIRFHVSHILALGVIPGPKKPQDFDSFLWPFLQELIRLTHGVRSFGILDSAFFTLRAYLILVFGDIPAISMVMRMKGHNGASPCHMCEI
jgi:hypothetical protein